MQRNRGSLDVQATVFLLFVAGLLTVLRLVVDFRVQNFRNGFEVAFIVAGFAFAFLYFVLTYVCWTRAENRMIFLGVALLSGWMSLVFVAPEIAASILS